MNKLAKLYCVTRKTIQYHLFDHVRLARKCQTIKWRKDNPAQSKILRKISKLRAEARAEARETGEALSDVYRRWGLSSAHDRPTAKSD
jgi:hypothetical protein